MTSSKQWTVGVACAMGLFIPAHAECELDEELGAASTRLGTSAAIHGDVAVAGAPYDDENGPRAGAAFVYRRQGADWVQEQKLLPADADDDDDFGVKVAVWGDVIVVGANRDEDAVTFGGSAYVFRHDGASWVEEQKLLASDAANSDQFGSSLAVHGSVIMVFAAQGDGAVPDSGAVYVFRYDGASWSEDQKIGGTADNDGFGGGLSIDGDLAVIGAPGVDPDGAAWVYRDDGLSWSEEQELVPLEVTSAWGGGVGISGDTAIFGAVSDNTNGSKAGALFVFRYDGLTWNQEARLLASDGVSNDGLGSGVAIDGETVIGGAGGDDDNGGSSGSAYVFHRDGVTWSEVAKLIPADGEPFDEFGDSATGLSGDTAVFGAEFAQDGGAVYFFRTIAGSDYNFNGLPDDCPAEVFAYNLTAATLHATIADAIGMAADGDALVATPGAFAAEEDVDFNGRAVSLTGMGTIDQPVGGVYALTEDATLAAPPASDITIAGELRVEVGDAADVESGDAFHAMATSDVVVRGGASLSIAASGVATFDGDTLVQPAGSLTVSTDLTNGGDLAAFNGAFLSVDGDFQNDGTASLLGGSTLAADAVRSDGTLQMSAVQVLADSLENLGGGTVVVSGDLFCAVANGGTVTCIGDTLVVSDYTNDDTTVVQIGTLTILGTLTNNGTIIGDVVNGFAGGTQPGDGLAVSGSFVAGAAATLSMPDPVWRLNLSGDYDVAIDDSARYDMDQATLRMAGAAQTLEVMSLDVGSDASGLNGSPAGHYPIGTLHVAAGSATTLVDAHDNDLMSQKPCEALYVRTLIVDAGAVLNTYGCPVYYETAQLDGIVNDPGDLVELPPLCPWDLTGDSDVGVNDFLALLALWGTDPGGPPDFNEDGDVGVADFLELLANWGLCP